MNPSFKLLLVLIIALEVSFTRHLTINLVLVAVAIIYLLTKRIRPRLFGWLFLMPLFPAVAVFITIAWFSPGHDYFYAWVLFSRIYVYVFTGAAITQTTSPLELTRSLEQNLHLPSKFAYGTLAAVNLIPRIKMAVKTIRAAGQMRGINLSWWSPTLYFKAILHAITWSDQLAQAMESHGYVEDRARTSVHQITLTARNWLILIISIILIQIITFALP